jgi:hypothetical protein
MLSEPEIAALFDEKIHRADYYGPPRRDPWCHLAVENRAFRVDYLLLGNFDATIRCWCGCGLKIELGSDSPQRRAVAREFARQWERHRLARIIAGDIQQASKVPPS